MKNLEEISIEMGGIEENRLEIVKDDPIGVFLDKIGKEEKERDISGRIDFSYLSPAQKAESMWALFQELKGRMSGRKSGKPNTKEIQLLKLLYEDEETKTLYLSENTRHLKEDAEINGNYDKYNILKAKLENIDGAIEESLKNLFSKRGGEVSEFDLLLLESNKRDLDRVRLEIETLIDEDPKLGALSQYEKLKGYSEQLKTEKFIWTQSRIEALERIERAALSGKPILISGESGTGKSTLFEATALKLTGLPCTRTAGKDTRFAREIATPGIKPEGGGEDFFRYKSVGFAVTGKNSTLDSRPLNEGSWVLDDEFNLHEDQLTRIDFVSKCVPGKEIMMPETNRLERVQKNFLYGAAVNLESEKYTRKKMEAPTIRKFAKVDLDYNEQTQENPEIYEMLLSALMDENGRVRGSKAELSPNYEYKEEKDRVTLANGQEISRNVKTRQLKDWEEVEVKNGGKVEKINQPVGGFLWKFANILNHLNLSFSHRETVLKHKKEGQYSKDLIIDIGTVLGWMNEYTKVRDAQGLEGFILMKIHEEFLDTNVYSKEDKQLLRDFFNYYGINTDKKPEEYDKVDFEVMTPNDIGLLSPRVKYKEVIRQDPIITEGRFVEPQGNLVEYFIKPFEDGRITIPLGKIIKDKEGRIFEFVGISKDKGEPIFKPYENSKKVQRQERNKPEVNNVQVEEIKQKNESFLKQTFEIWYDAQKAQVEQKPIIVNPKDQDYDALKNDTNPTKFGEYTVNPETQNINLEKTRIVTLPKAEQKALEGKQLHEVAEYIKTTYGNRYHIPGIEFWKYILENPDKAPNELKDGKYHFYFGSLIRPSDGYWNVPYASWRGSLWYRYRDRLDYSWDSDYRVVLLETI